MNLLVVSPNLPYPSSGASTRNYYLLRAFASQHRVSLVALVDSAQLQQANALSLLEEFVETVQLVVRPHTRLKRWRQLERMVFGGSHTVDEHMHREMQSTIDRLCAQNAFDLVLFESVLMAGYHLPANVRTVIDQHNIEHELLLRTFEQETAWLRKWYCRLESARLKPIELALCHKVDAVLVTSQREQQTLRAYLPEAQIEVVPNGVDLATFKAQENGEEIANRIIFTGTIDYYPNSNAILFFAQRCWPFIRKQIPGATWYIVGRNPPAEIQNLAQLPGVTVTGTVPDVRPYLASAAVAIAPLQIGSGTRLKILEALAMRKAVVTTSIGCEGLSVTHEKELLIADHPEEFAQAVVTLLQNQKLRASLGNAGRELVEAEYSWEYCGSQALRVLETSFKERKPYASTRGA